MQEKGAQPIADVRSHESSEFIWKSKGLGASNNDTEHPRGLNDELGTSRHRHTLIGFPFDKGRRRKQ